jgi:hypothetical protein
MAGALDDIVQKVVIEGTGEVGGLLGEMAGIAETAFGRISTAATLLNSALSGPIGIILAVVGAVTALAEATTKFAESQARAQVALNATAKVYGATRDEIVGLRVALSQSGLTGEEINRGLQRMARQMANSWSEVTSEIRKGPTAMAEARNGIESAQLGIATAMTNNKFAAAEWANKLKGDALSVAEAYNKVKFAAEDAASTSNNDFLSVQGAQLGAKEAEINFRKSQGYGGYEQDEAQLKVDKAANAFYQAQQRVQDAQTKQLKDMANAPIERQRAELGLSEAQNKQAKDQESEGPAIAKAAVDFRSAVNAFEQAVEKMHDTELKDLPTIINAIKDKNGDALRDMKPTDIVHAIDAQTRQQVEQLGKVATDLDLLKGRGEAVKSLEGTISEGQMQGVLQAGGLPARGGQAAQWVDAIKNLGERLPEALKLSQGAGGTDQNQANAENTLKMVAATDEMKSTMARLAGTSDIASATAQATLEVQQGILIGVREAPAKFAEALKGLQTPVQGLSDAAAAGAGLAGGGQIFGAGTSTSDSIPARLSHGEFVVKAAAVKAYGADLFHSLNSMAIRGFAMGGLVPGPGMAPIRFADGGAVKAQHSVVNLSIDGNRFEGLKAPADVAQKLTSYAVSRQTSQTGRRPSWVR